MTKSIKNSYHNRDLTQKELEFFKEELEFFEKELKEKKAKIEQNLKATTEESCNQTANQCGDEGDQALLEITNNVNSTLIREQSITLNKINRSLNKIALGTYGFCTECEEAINVDRLKIQMFTEYCVPCKELMEKQS